MKVYATAFGCGHLELQGFNLESCRVSQIGGIRKINDDTPEWVESFMSSTGFLVNSDKIGVHIKNVASTSSIAAINALGGTVEKLDGFSEHGCSVKVKVGENQIIYPNEGGYFSSEMTNESVFEAVIHTYTSGVYPS